jgi:hypothetical protein
MRQGEHLVRIEAAQCGWMRMENLVMVMMMMMRRRRRRRV